MARSAKRVPAWILALQLAAAAAAGAPAMAEPVVPLQAEISFPFKDRTATLELSLPASEFAKYGELPHTFVFPFSYQMALAQQDRVARRVAAAARFVAEQHGWSERDLAAFLFFVAQYVPYNYDSEHMVGDYVRYPGETFFMTGDCEDKSLLAHALLAAADLETILVSVSDEDAGHVLVGVGVEARSGDAVIEHRGRRFVMTEVSMPHWEVGRIAEDQSFENMQVHRSARDPRRILPRSLETLPPRVRDLADPALRWRVDASEPTVLGLYVEGRSARIWATRYPSRESAREVLRFVETWQTELSPFYVDSETLRSVRVLADQMRLRWE